MNARALGLVIAAAGALALVIGLLVAAGAFGWFGRLPGDIRIETGGTKVFIPITSMLLVSVALTLISGIVRRFF